nr:unnamed protein product [Callosobruchus analis]
MDCTSSEEEDEVLGRFYYKRRIYAESMANFLEEFNKGHAEGRYDQTCENQEIYLASINIIDLIHTVFLISTIHTKYQNY